MNSGDNSDHIVNGLRFVSLTMCSFRDLLRGLETELGQDNDFGAFKLRPIPMMPASLIRVSG